MSYTALYRKFRPQDFSDVKGQDHIVTTLKNELRTDRIGHAYLFTGTRGTGKTSVAKIFARAVNCEHPKEDGSPCGACAPCISAANGSSMNVIEIDAASNNGVDNIRQIIDEVAYPPTEGRFKVYIIDEVHMLSAGAFNALLKTLEEPPAYVIFILATTEVHKIPITILSRCQRYDFRRISIETIADRLQELLTIEGTEAEDKAVRYIAKAADGSMRDALSLLDQCIAFYIDQRLTYENVLEVLGAVDIEIFSRLLRCIIKKDAAGAIGIIEEIVMEGRELSQFVTDFSWYLRNLMLVKEIEDLSDILDMSAENLKTLREEADMVESEVITRYIRVMSELSNQLRYATQKRVLLEITVIRLCRPQGEEDLSALVDRISALEAAVENGAVFPAGADAGGVPGPAGRYPGGAPGAGGFVPAAAPEKQRLPDAVPEEVQRVCREWKALIREFGQPDVSHLSRALVSVSPENALLLVFDTGEEKSRIAYDWLSSGDRKEALEERLGEKLGSHVPVVLKDNRTDTPGKDLYEDAIARFAATANITIETEDF